jgi:hypothetical protein
MVNNQEMVKLVHELENQQLANLILKNKIASLQQAASNSSSQKLNSIKSMSNSPINSSTPSPNNNNNTCSNETLKLLNNSNATATNINNNQFQSDDHGSLNSTKSPLNVESDGIFNFKSSIKSTCQEEDDENKNYEENGYMDENNNEEDDDYDEEIYEDCDERYLKIGQDGAEFNGIKNKPNKSIKTKQKEMRSNGVDKAKPLDQQTVDNASTSISSLTRQTSSSSSSPRTPKSALLEKRRKAVFELLIHDTYPSGKIIFHFII